MADRTSAGIFGELIAYLADQPVSPQRDDFLKKVWNMTLDYDFTQDQMGVDEQLVKIGFAWRAPDPRWPNDGDVTHYLERLP